MKDRIILGVIGFLLSCSLLAIYMFALIISKQYDFNVIVSDTTASFSEFTAEDYLTLYSFNASSNINAQPNFDVDETTPSPNWGTQVNDQESVREKINEVVVKTPTLKDEGINEHYIGRLSIPALGIEDALYYSGDDFYLQKNRNGRESSAGELYIDGRSSGNLLKLDNLINGHSMNNGSKFGKLKNITKQQDPVYIYIKEYRTGKVYVYEIFSANLVSNDDSGVHLVFNSMREREIYYEKFKSMSIIGSNVTDFNGNILTLNTCDYTKKDGHLLVFAKLVEWR